MAKYEIQARRVHWYKVTIEADGEMDAIEQVRDWMAEDWEDANLEVQAEWNFDAIKKEEN
jgi:hypothetical protein